MPATIQKDSPEAAAIAAMNKAMRLYRDAVSSGTAFDRAGAALEVMRAAEGVARTTALNPRTGAIKL